MSELKQIAIAAGVLGFVVFIIFSSVSKKDEEFELHNKLLNNPQGITVSVGKVYAMSGGKGGPYAKFVYYFHGEKRTVDYFHVDRNTTAIGSFYGICYPNDKPEEAKLISDYEVTDTARIISAGFQRVTRYHYDIATATYIPYKTFK